RGPGFGRDRAQLREALRLPQPLGARRGEGRLTLRRWPIMLEEAEKRHGSDDGPNVSTQIHWSQAHP
ncbi:MAG: hypothetical protein EBT10_06035, partial [Methylocystaceae bacterium]|nr:hypothetical protein [Methylocystaceae bacterium]